MYVLRRILNPMGTMDAIEFLIDKLRSTKTNGEFFKSMNTSRAPRASTGTRKGRITAALFTVCAIAQLAPGSLGRGARDARMRADQGLDRFRVLPDVARTPRG